MQKIMIVQLKKIDRPVVIDFYNNILKSLKEHNHRNERRSDLELLEEVVNWSKNHNQVPDIDSSNSQERRYAEILFRIQSKYSKYLEQEVFDKLEETKAEEIQKIIRKGSEINLWEIFLTPSQREKIKQREEELFEVEELITDLVDIESEIELEEEKSSIDKLLEIAKILHDSGVDFSKVKITKNINGRIVFISLKEINQEGIDIEKIIEENGLDESYKIGAKLCYLKRVYNGTERRGSMTEEQKNEAEELGLIPEKMQLKRVKAKRDSAEELNQKVRKKEKELEGQKKMNNNMNDNNKFIDEKTFKDIKEKERIIRLKTLYDNNQITEEDISDEDIDKIIELYKKETKLLNEDTKRRLEKIEKIIKSNNSNN